MNLIKSIFGNLPDGRQVDLFVLENDNDITIKITNFGGAVTHLLVPDKNGNTGDVVLGFDKLENYLGEHPFMGVIVGRYANRIAHGKFTLNGKEHRLLVNNGPNHLHGGGEGFDKKLWKATSGEKNGIVFLRLTYTSLDLEEGYPGNLITDVTYSLNNENEFIIEYNARSNRDTIINLTNHSYFNLNIQKGEILDHFLKLDCSAYTPVNEFSIPTGEIKAVKSTPFDFTGEKTIGQDFSQLGNGYDHNFVIDKDPGEFKWFAKVREEESGRILQVGTTEPGVQLYTANYVKDIEGKNGIVYQPQYAFCLETQHFPDSPNKPGFPPVILRAGEHYFQKTVYKFSTD